MYLIRKIECLLSLFTGSNLSPPHPVLTWSHRPRHDAPSLIPVQHSLLSIAVAVAAPPHLLSLELGCAVLYPLVLSLPPRLHVCRRPLSSPVRCRGWSRCARRVSARGGRPDHPPRLWLGPVPGGLFWAGGGGGVCGGGLPFAATTAAATTTARRPCRDAFWGRRCRGHPPPAPAPPVAPQKFVIPL